VISRGGTCATPETYDLTARTDETPAAFADLKPPGYWRQRSVDLCRYAYPKGKILGAVRDPDDLLEPMRSSNN
jgi:hypothetical protein